VKAESGGESASNRERERKLGNLKRIVRPTKSWPSTLRVDPVPSGGVVQVDQLW
jgi:hypothetical protein